ncbi:hypothetical protein PHLGIDRAFT_489438 [Phlebiopsis gigantea 11061_1 CR5-6]|uniref:Uncharacterized protein n=1 Tax=Phlebiopsis gigantea (strain 11061_1 CR5-6) TaxID=745531 RepID=A0A0C3SF28_PHLG1|nr:hypothetical protein PHLGIDRAFT_489438 [Phlebiopsis gigantea 11061_1 CR5-6]
MSGQGKKIRTLHIPSNCRRTRSTSPDRSPPLSRLHAGAGVGRRGGGRRDRDVPGGRANSEWVLPPALGRCAAAPAEALSREENATKEKKGNNMASRFRTSRARPDARPRGRLGAAEALRSVAVGSGTFCRRRWWRRRREGLFIPTRVYIDTDVQRWKVLSSLCPCASAVD